MNFIFNPWFAMFLVGLVCLAAVRWASLDTWGRHLALVLGWLFTLAGVIGLVLVATTG